MATENELDVILKKLLAVGDDIIRVNSDLIKNHNKLASKQLNKAYSALSDARSQVIKEIAIVVSGANRARKE